MSNGRWWLTVWALVFGICSWNLLVAQDGSPAQTESRLILESIDWFQSIVADQSPSSNHKLPPLIETSVSQWSSHQTERFTTTLRDLYSNSIKGRFNDFYGDSSVPVDEYVSTFTQITRLLRSKEHRFRNQDSIRLERLALKIFIVFRFGEETWNRFKEIFQVKLWAGLDAAQSAEEKQKFYWDLVTECLQTLFADHADAGDWRMNELKLISEMIRSYKMEQPLFYIAFKLTHHFKFGETEFATVAWDNFSKSVNDDFRIHSELESRQFIEDASSGRLRHLIGDDIKLRFAVLQSGGRSHLVTRVYFPRGMGEIVVINPPHTLSNGGLSSKDPALRNYLYRQDANLVLVDLNDGSFKIAEVIQRDSWWNPVKIFRFLRATYRSPTSGTAALAMISVIANAGPRYLILEQASQQWGGDIHFSWLALALVAGYSGFCALFGRWYDNVMSSRQPLWEVFKKTLFAMPFTTLGYMLLTHDDPMKAFMYALPLALLEKLGSTYSRRWIRLLEKEHILKGFFTFRMGPKDRHSKIEIKVENGLLARESESYLRSFLLSIGATNNHYFGILAQVLWAQMFNIMSLKLIHGRFKKAAQLKDLALVDYYQSLKSKAVEDLHFIPGLKRLLNSLSSKCKTSLINLRKKGLQ